MHNTSNMEQMPLLENTSDIGERSDTEANRRHRSFQVSGVESRISTTAEENFRAESTQEGYVEAFKRFCIRNLCCGDSSQFEDESVAERVNKPIGKAIDHFTDKGNLIKAIKSFPEAVTKEEEDVYRSKNSYIPIYYGYELPPGNCHSYTLTNGEGGIIRPHSVNVALRDNGHRQILTGSVGTPPDLSSLRKRSQLRVGNIVTFYEDHIKETNKGFVYNADEQSVGDEVLGPGMGSNRDNDVVAANDRPFVIHDGWISRIENGRIYITSKHGNYGLYETEISDATLGLGSKYAIFFTKRKKGRILSEEKPIRHRRYSHIIQWRHGRLRSIWSSSNA